MSMSIAPSKRSGMTLYSGASDPYSHRVRMVVAEKEATLDILDIDKISKAKEELNQLNPYGTAPLLIDRELVLYQSELIMEYLDERFPHPSLLPVSPAERARSRLLIYRFNRDWYSLMDKILFLQKMEPKSAQILEIQKELKDSITSIAPAFADSPYFLSEEFSLIDCCLAPLLWRLPLLGVVLPPQAKSVLVYAERLFTRGSFLVSLTETELAMPR